ncbi:hypothetical protein AUEXF2481DRAFT_31364 [Aureobasidium subglaciale EXF-2481]|uniref:Uncharacterized protein n=1 Tax=Aureobasidium subglaciale (strain EXF-2481) TaxID=1043005 RepID=A0A074YBE6_AURSE|nr:uncharacterized protein AUEXF2481DRAFT_31364 [Aureobasidium subglaciale EXF-2481]KAI5199880.1 hypothetical protein E4T38_06802 [Aureobasidium subglaciale]KAI5218794.1 hypothetical protein E4T40_06788 [Aureobasidium subglaciale]KAI5222366.1 hypothetical protein E4T41_06653 [Aureobasidium subglaciale]KAI5259811.1 hypothetical protein E4T46_06594 [Aureobasidium subglaciale]KEQ93339.1 hypothetical protein AUEXF2481DRAFT_31364 [Aureobasidium subglaciale EXF-2481]
MGPKLVKQGSESIKSTERRPRHNKQDRRNPRQDKRTRDDHTENEANLDNYTRPILLTSGRWLWCRDKRAENWLLTRHLPWWFFASFINFCAYVHEKAQHNDNLNPDEQRLLIHIKEYPLAADDLIAEMQCYLAICLVKGKLSQGLIFIDTANKHDMEVGQKALMRVVFTPKERQAHIAAEAACSSHLRYSKDTTSQSQVDPISLEFREIPPAVNPVTSASQTWFVHPDMVSKWQLATVLAIKEEHKVHVQTEEEDDEVVFRGRR